MRGGLKIKHWGMLFGISLILSNTIHGQLRISEEIKPSEIVTSDAHKLYLIDFWATWCGPCVSAKKYLGVLQKQFPEDLYIISLTQETPEVVRKFLKKHETGLAIAIDYDKETFRKYGIRSLPNSILFSADGEMLWNGHPSNLKAQDIKNYLRRSPSAVSRDAFIKLQAYKKVSAEKTEEHITEREIEISEIKNGPEILEIDTNQDFTIYKGNLKSILAYLTGVSNHQMHLSPEVKNGFYRIVVKQGGRKERNLLKHVMRELRIRYDYNNVQGEVLVLDSNNPNLWNTEQIEWGTDNPKYLIDDTQIQADNVTFEDIKYRLAFVLEMPVIGEIESGDTEHDWQVHYKYFQLMRSDLLDNYGINAEKKRSTYPVYVVEKKAP